jgi:hypothetical protein
MTREEEIGLLGELWTLHRLFAVSGSKAVESWVAVDPESHDFRFGTTDLEVKTTVSNERLHTINNPSQVLPLEGHTLYLLSIQLAPSGVGNGHTLPEAIELLTRSLENDPASMEIFHRGLERRGYRGSDTPQYRTRFKLRNKCALIPIDTFFPAITKDDIVDLLGPDRAIRISRFQYSVKLDGLGELDGSMDFLAVIPSAQSGDLL